MSQSQQRQLGAIILGAGKGTRMKSDLPKVVFPVGGRAMVCAVVEACRDAGVERIVVVVGHKQELVRRALDGFGVEFVVQDQQLGTGHAVGCAEGLLRGFDGDVLVLCGDGPLIRPGTIRRLVQLHRETGASATLATSVIDDPTGYGRIVRDGAGRFAAIVEQKNCTPAQRSIREVNPSYYCFRTPALFTALRDVRRNEVSGEYYLTDVPELMLRAGLGVEVMDAVPPEDVLSINTPEDLARVDVIYASRRHAASAKEGA